MLLCESHKNIYIGTCLGENDLELAVIAQPAGTTGDVTNVVEARYLESSSCFQPRIGFRRCCILLFTSTAGNESTTMRIRPRIACKSRKKTVLVESFT